MNADHDSLKPKSEAPPNTEVPVKPDLSWEDIQYIYQQKLGLRATSQNKIDDEIEKGFYGDAVSLCNYWDRENRGGIKLISADEFNNHYAKIDYQKAIKGFIAQSITWDIRPQRDLGEKAAKDYFINYPTKSGFLIIDTNTFEADDVDNYHGLGKMGSRQVPPDQIKTSIKPDYSSTVAWNEEQNKVSLEFPYEEFLKKAVEEVYENFVLQVQHLRAESLAAKLEQANNATNPTKALEEIAG